MDKLLAHLADGVVMLHVVSSQIVAASAHAEKTSKSFFARNNELTSHCVAIETKLGESSEQ
jgi:hypothetical protein